VLAQLLASEGRSDDIAAATVCADWTALREEGPVTADRIAAVAAWLCSAEASIVSGATVTADAGRTIAIGDATTRRQLDPQEAAVGLAPGALDRP
jgi:enoyl-[acyl-carrier-protein] reductase (NADH)